MAVVERRASPDTVTERVRNGVIGGLAGGVVFGMMMGMMGMLPMVAGLVGSTSAIVGFLVHMVISAIIGAIYGLALGGATTSWASALGLGAAYGVVWWFLGPLLIMPTMMGMGPQLTPGAMSEQIPSLIGHIVFGLITGAVYFWLRREA
jgi:uncharacterized membrane protein YagU involved in acid resistance